MHIKCSRSWSHSSKPAVILKVNQYLVKYKHLTDDSDSRALQTARHGDSLLCNVASLREGPAGSPCVTSLSFLCVAWLGYQRAEPLMSVTGFVSVLHVTRDLPGVFPCLSLTVLAGTGSVTNMQRGQEEMKTG